MGTFRVVGRNPEDIMAARHKVLGPLTLTDDIIAFESGELDGDGIIKLFQNLVDTGLAWQLQGFYGRTAHQLIEAGLVIQKVAC